MQGYQNQIHHFLEQKTIVVQLVEHHSEARIALFFSDYHTKHTDEITNQDVMDVNTHYILKKNLSIPLDKLKLNDYKYCATTTTQFAAHNIPKKEILCNKREKPLHR